LSRRRRLLLGGFCLTPLGSSSQEIFQVTGHWIAFYLGLSISTRETRSLHAC
jgi:hypothetical protein